MDLDDVRALAREAHAGQTDKQGRDYYEAHLEPVARALRERGIDAEMAGLLHDIIEDTHHAATSLSDLGVPQAVVDAVVSVTKVEGEHYDDTIDRAAAHPLGRVVKLADNAYNLASNPALAETHPVRAAELKQKYERARATLLAAEPQLQ